VPAELVEGRSTAEPTRDSSDEVPSPPGSP